MIRIINDNITIIMILMIAIIIRIAITIYTTSTMFFSQASVSFSRPVCCSLRSCWAPQQQEVMP
jgi:hypothetical protein